MIPNNTERFPQIIDELKRQLTPHGIPVPDSFGVQVVECSDCKMTMHAISETARVDTESNDDLNEHAPEIVCATCANQRESL